MNSRERIDYGAWSADRLRAELTRLEENLRDLEETHAFTFCRTSVHIGAEQAQSIQEAYEDERAACRKRISEIERALRGRG